MNTKLFIQIAVVCIGMIHQTALAKLKCEALFSSAAQGPVGHLQKSDRKSYGSQPGRWYTDELGTSWYLKQDIKYQELQTGAEKVSAEIYKEFGYDAPEVQIYEMDGLRFAAVKELPPPKVQPKDKIESQFRQLRWMIAFLKDFDRATNLRRTSNTLQIWDFGGSLGARARGEHKPGSKLDVMTGQVVPGSIFSPAIGGIEPWRNPELIFAEFQAPQSSDHPWNNLNQKDAAEFIKKLQSLTVDKITTIVESAKYSSDKDTQYLIQVLRNLRTTLLEYLLTEYFPSEFRSKYLNTAAVEHKTKQASPNLTPEELWALSEYTASSFRLNAALWKNNQHSADPLPMAISAALKKFPVFKGVVYRGPKTLERVGKAGYSDVSDKYLDSLIVGNTIVHPGFTSSTFDPKAHGVGWDLDQSKIILVIYSKTGHDISSYSKCAYEKEILFDMGTKFKVLSKNFDTVHEQWFVELEEVP